MNPLLLQKALRHLRIAKGAIDAIEREDGGYEMGDSLSEIIEALEHTEGELEDE